MAERRALVLGGGGSTGNAWLVGVTAGLLESGLDVTAADIMIGTSAGSTAAAQIASATPAQLLFEILSEVPQKQARSETDVRPSPVTFPTHFESTSEMIVTATDVSDMRRKLGAAALAMTESSDGASQEQWRATVASRLPSPHWPRQSLLIPAVNARTAEPVVFSSESGVDLVDAIAASCAGRFAYTIGHNQYIDGGYRTDVNADLATGCQHVLIIPPLGFKTRKPQRWGLNIAAQIETLRAAGSIVHVITPDSDSDATIGVGMELMDFSMRGGSAQAGYNQGKAVSQLLLEFWCGSALKQSTDGC